MAQISRRHTQHLTSTQNGVDVQYTEPYNYADWLELLKQHITSVQNIVIPYQTAHTR